MTEITRVGAADFAVEEDLPIGQVLRRFGERRLGLAHEDNALTPVQERLAALMARQANGVHARAHAKQAPTRRPLHLDVGSRYLPLRVDAGFGRFGSFEHQDLMPKGTWVYQLDADLLRLWVEEELAAQAEAQGWIRAESWAIARRTPETDRPTQAPRQAPARRPTIGHQLPPAVRKTLAPRRDQIRGAVLAAVRGDTSALVRLTHGSAVARRLLAKIQARTAEITSATRGESTLAPRHDAPPPVALTPRPLSRIAAALDHEDLIALREELPMLAVDAADPNFSFEGAAKEVMRTARAAARLSKQRPDAPGEPQRRPSIVTRALQLAHAKQVGNARMFARPGDPDAGDEAAALALTPFMPRLLGASTGPELDITVADRAVERRLFARHSTQRTDRAQEFGAQALKALRFDTRHTHNAEPDVSTYWLREGGRGVLLAGLDDSDGGFDRPADDAWTRDPSRAQSWTQPERADHRAQVTAHRLATALAAISARPLITASPMGDRPSDGLSSYAPLAVAASPAATRSRTLALTSHTLAAAIGPQTTGAAAPVPTRHGPAAVRQRAILADPTVRGYDAMIGGDFADVVAVSLVQQIAARAGTGLGSAAQPHSREALPLGPGQTQGLAPGATALTPLGTRAATPRQLTGVPPSAMAAGHVSALPIGRVAVLQDVVLHGSYLPTLVRSIGELQRAARLLGRLQPAALGAAAPVASLEARVSADRLGGVIARLGALAARPTPSLAIRDDALLQTRAAQAASRLADAIRDARHTVSGTPADSASGYDTAAWWGVNSVLLEMETATQSATSGLDAWSGQVDPFQRIERAVELATQRAQTTVVAQLAQIARVASAYRGATPAPSQVQAQTTRAGSSLRLFSPEKTVALIAPELESGGLLDVGARRALSQALESLSRGSSSSTATRSVRTPFGTIKIHLDHGRIVVDTEEISSNAPVVTIAAQPTARASARPLTTAPTRSTRGHANAFDVERAHRDASQFATGAMARRLESSLPQVLAAMRGVNTRLDVLIGGPARAQITNDRASGPLRAAVTEVAGVRSRLESVLKAPAAEMAARFAALAKSTPALATSRLDAAGDVIRLFAGSERAARVIETLSAGGFAQPTLGPIAIALPATPPDVGTPDRQQMAARVQYGQLGRALASLGTHRASNVARVLRELSEGRDVALPVAARSAEALGELLSEAADARAIGTLGQLGMARAVAPGMSRADLAYILPYTQRAATWADAQPAWSAAATAQTAPGIALPSPASSLLEFAVSLGRGRALLDGISALNLSAAGTAGPESGFLADGPDAIARPGRIGLGLANAGRTVDGYQGVSSRAETTFVSPQRAVSRSIAAREAARFVRLETALAPNLTAPPRTARSTPSRPGVLRPRSLAAGVLKNLQQVRSVLEGLGSTARPSAGPQLNVGMSAGPGTLVSSAKRSPRAVDTPLDADSAHRQPNLATGTAGVWMPAGVERLVADTADAIVSQRTSLAGALVAPRLLTPHRTRSGRSSGRPQRQTSAGEAGFEAIAHRVAMGLRTLRITPGIGDRGDTAGALLAVGAGGSALNASPWLTSTRSQEGARRLAASLGMEWTAPGTDRAQAAAGIELQAPQLIAPGSAPGDGPGALFRPPGATPKPRVRAAKAPGELFTPPKAPKLPTSENFGASAPQQDAVAPRAARTQDTSGGMVERAEAEDRTGMAHQSGVPSQDNIEDIAYEVLSELKRRWSHELERRGTE